MTVKIKTDGSVVREQYSRITKAQESLQKAADELDEHDFGSPARARDEEATEFPQGAYKLLRATIEILDEALCQLDAWMGRA